MAEYIIEDNGWIENGGYIRPAPSGWLPPKPIVRCRDCKHVKHDPEWQPDGDRRYKPREVWFCRAEQWEGFEGDNPFVVPDGFCAWGEKEER